MTPEKQINRLAAFIIKHVPGEPSRNESAVDTAIRLLKQHVPVPIDGERYWACKIGPAPAEVPDGGDSPLRMAAAHAFEQMFGCEAVVLSSGWGGHMTADEREL